MSSLYVIKTNLYKTLLLNVDYYHVLIATELCIQKLPKNRFALYIAFIKNRRGYLTLA